MIFGQQSGDVRRASNGRKVSRMKRMLLACACALLSVMLFAAPAYAQEPAEIDLWVEIQGGGTAAIATETGSPLPEQTTLTLASGQIEAFHLVFTGVGEYSYILWIEPDDRDLNFDDTVYLIGVYVTNEGDALVANVVVNRSGDSGKYVPTVEDSEHPLKVVFQNTPQGGDDPTNPTNPDSPDNPSGPDNPGGADNPSGATTPVIPAANVNAVTPGTAPNTGDASLPVAHIVVLVCAALVFLLVARVLKAKMGKPDDSAAADGIDTDEGRR